jgi:hypothetical protein
MTQSLFSPGFSRVCVPIVYVSSNYRDIVFLGNAPIPKYKAPGTDRSISWLRMETKGLHNPHRLRKTWISPERPKITNADLGPLMLHASGK